MIKYAIKPILEKKGYKIILKQIGESNLFNSFLVDGDIDINIGQHKSALNFFKANNKADISPLITVPSAHMGIFSDKLNAKNLDELKKGIKKGDIVAMPNDPTNLPRSLIFLQNTGFIKLRSDVDKYTSTVRDIAENYYGLDFRVMTADQIPRSLNSITFGLIFGDDADLIGIFDKSIIREVITILAIAVLGSTATAGMVRGGGIGDLAITYGYYRYQTDVMVVTVVILTVLVQLLQSVGDWSAKKAEKK